MIAFYEVCCRNGEVPVIIVPGANTGHQVMLKLMMKVSASEVITPEQLVTILAYKVVEVDSECHCESGHSSACSPSGLSDGMIGMFSERAGDDAPSEQVGHRFCRADD